MKVTFVNRMVGFVRGGGEIWDLHIAEQLEAAGVDVQFLTARPLRARAPQPVEAFPSVEIPTPHLQEHALSAPRGVGGVLADIDAAVFARRATSALEELEQDVVQIANRPAFARHVPRIDDPTVIKLSGPPYSLWYDVLNPFTSSYDRLEAFDAVVGIGTAAAAVRKRTSLDVTAINPGVDTDRFAPGETGGRAQSHGVGGASGPTLLFVGRFVPAKNLELLVEAFARLRADHPRSELVLVGDGPLREEIERTVATMGLGEHVRLPGYVDNAELPELYRRSDVFVLSSRTENHPIALMEAMSSGTPVVAPRIGWIPEMVDHGETGLLFEAGAVDQLVEQIDRLLRSADLRERLSGRGRAEAVGRFDWESRATALLEVLETVAQPER
jgi:glycosyltransferase involved in cell wall biosynthesis